MNSELTINEDDFIDGVRVFYTLGELLEELDLDEREPGPLALSAAA